MSFSANGDFLVVASTEEVYYLDTKTIESNEDGPAIGSLITLSVLCLVAIVGGRKKQLAE